MSAEVLVADAARMRCTMSPGPSAGVFIQIQDLRQGKILMLMPAKKQAMLAEIANSPMQQINLLKEFQDAEPRSGKPIGQREIGGRQAKGFNVTEPGMRLQMWVDAETKLPVLAEMDAQAGMMPASHVTFTDFAWNVPVDESLLSLTPPAGYQMLPAMKMDMSPASEKDLVAGLKAIAELNGGAFPPGVDMAGLMGIMKQMDKRFDKFDKAQQDKFMGEVRASMLQIGRMWMFIGDSKNGEDWHYAGEGAPFGQAGRPVFWYRPTGAATYRVINADLTVHDVPPENLPKIPSKIVTKPMIAPAPTPPNR
jgi:hypothetical protein